MNRKYIEILGYFLDFNFTNIKDFYFEIQGDFLITENDCFLIGRYYSKIEVFFFNA